MSDITDILRDWPYDSSACVRKLTAEDGRDVLQVRTPLGLEQYELQGRPDGERPHGCESVLEHVEGLIREHVTLAGSTDGFEIDGSTASELQNEGLLYYYRYLVCFQVGEYEIVASDAGRNLRMFDIIRAYCPDEETIHGGEQYRPYVMRMHAAAKALQAVGEARYGGARKLIDEAVDAITHLPDVPTSTFEYEKERSLAILRGMLRAIPATKPPTTEELLRKELHEAVTAENYERAAEIRDQLRAISRRREHSTSPTPDSRT